MEAAGPAEGADSREAAATGKTERAGSLIAILPRGCPAPRTCPPKSNRQAARALSIHSIAAAARP